MSDFCCYIIYSDSLNSYYIGETEQVHLRTYQHNSGYFSGAYTSRASDWKLKLVIPCENRSHARRVESFIKKMKSRKFIEKLIVSPALVADITNKCKI